jgi:hypothetical protein
MGGLAALVSVVLVGAGISQMPLQAQNAGTPLGAATVLNCSGSSTCSLTGGILTISSPSSSSGGGGGGHTIQDEAVSLTARTNLNFTGAGISCADNAGSTRTDCTVASAGITPGGSASSVQFNAGGGSLGGLVYAASDGAGYLTLPSSPIPAPPTNGATLFARTRANRALLAWMAPSGVDQFAQPAIWSNGVGYTIFTGASAGKSDAGWATTAVGTAAAAVFSGGTMASSTKRAPYSTGATNGTAAGIYVSSPATFWRGNAAGLGGFFCQFRWINHVPLSTSQAFIGLSTNIGAPSGTQAVVNATSSLFAGWSSASTTAALCGNDATGSATCVDCGANFAKNSPTSTFALSIYSAPSSTTASLELKRLDVDIASCTTTFSAVGGLPSNTSFLAPRIYAANGSAANFGISFIMMYCESDN